jgi:hypothetical protein
MIAAMMIRTLAESLIRDTYVLTHRACREWAVGPMSTRVRGEFVQSDPASWRKRTRVNVKSGLSVAERSARKQAMAEVIMQQEKLAQAGYNGILVDAKGYWTAINDWTIASGLDTADAYFLNPSSQASMQAAQQAAQRAEAEQQFQQKMVEQATTAQQQSTAMEQMIKKYDIDMQRAFDYWNATLKAEVESLRDATAGDPELNAQQAAGSLRSVEAERSSSADVGQRAAGSGAA